MAGTIPDVGKTLALTIVMDLDRNPTAFLWKSNIIPSRTTTLGDLTPCDFDGYADIPLSGPSSPVITSEDSSTIEFDPITFTADVAVTPQTVYGWAVKVDNLDGDPELFYVEKFPAQIDIVNPGLVVSFTPQFFSNQGELT